MKDSDGDMLTVPALARRIGRDPKTVRTWLKDPKLRALVVVDVPSGYQLISWPRWKEHVHGKKDVA